MKQIKVRDASITPVCVNKGWIVVSIIFMLLTACMAYVAVRNAKLLDCVHVYEDGGQWYCISEVEGV